MPTNPFIMISSPIYSLNDFSLLKGLKINQRMKAPGKEKITVVKIRASYSYGNSQWH